MRYVAPISRKWLLSLAILAWSGLVCAQTANTANTPPTLRDGKNWLGYVRVWYREADYHISIITVRFRINTTGQLDSVRVEGGPAAEKDSIRSQLVRLNGRWVPQMSEGKPVLSKWLCFRWYISGYYGGAVGVNKEEHDQINAAYEREQTLFQCSSGMNKPYSCRTYFIEGTDYFWYPPFYSEPVR